MTNDLAGLHVLVTRPSPAGEVLCALIAERSGSAFHFPVIAFESLVETPAFKAALAAIDGQDWLIFNSPQAVTAMIPSLQKAWPILPEKVRVAAVGAGTAAALQAAGYEAVLFPEEEWSSEGLLAMPAFQAVSGQHVMIVRGVGGRERLEKVLNDRDAVVTSCMAYQRILPDIDPVSCIHAIHHHMFHAAVAGSFESVTNLKLLLGDIEWPSLRELPLIVMSERIKNLAVEMGFETVWVAPNASQQALLDLLSEKKEVLCQMKKTK